MSLIMLYHFYDGHKGRHVRTLQECAKYTVVYTLKYHSWWRHQMETFSALLALCAGNSPVTGEFHAQMPVARSFGVIFDLRLNKRVSWQ